VDVFDNLLNTAIQSTAVEDDGAVTLVGVIGTFLNREQSHTTIGSLLEKATDMPQCMSMYFMTFYGFAAGNATAQGKKRRAGAAVSAPARSCPLVMQRQ
jgi:hypothetical protein